MATYHRVGWFPPRGPGVYVHELMISFDAEAGAEVAAYEGVGYHHHAGRFSAAWVLVNFSSWLKEPEMAWMKPWLGLLAEGDAAGARGVLEAYRERHGSDPETLEW